MATIAAAAPRWTPCLHGPHPHALSKLLHRHPQLDRLGRSLPHLLATVTDLADRQVGFRSLTEGIDTTTAAGRMVFAIFGALADFERSLIRERTVAGLEAARARGKRLRPARRDDPRPHRRRPSDGRR